MDFYNVLLAKKTDRVLQFGNLYDRLFETWINRARQILKDLPTGSISTVNDAAPLPLNALKVSVEAWQEGSGDPSPSNIRPIHGWSSASLYDTGVNLWDEETEVGNIDTTTGENSYASNCLRSSNYIAVKGGVAIMIVSPTNGRYFSYNADKVYIGNAQFSPSGGYVTVTPSSDTAYIRFILSTNYGTTYNNDVSINYPSSDTSYHAYNPNSITQQVDFGQDVYVGSANLLTGEGTLIYLLISENDFEDYYSSESGGGLHWVDYPNENVKLNGNAKCNMLNQDNANAWNSTVPVLQLGTSSRRVRVYCSDESLADFKTTFNGLQICYELAEPIPFTFTPIPTTKMFQGTNNLYVDCGEVLSGKYWAEV